MTGSYILTIFTTQKHTKFHHPPWSRRLGQAREGVHPVRPPLGEAHLVVGHHAGMGGAIVAGQKGGEPGIFGDFCGFLTQGLGTMY